MKNSWKLSSSITSHFFFSLFNVLNPTISSWSIPISGIGTLGPMGLPSLRRKKVTYILSWSSGKSSSAIEVLLHTIRHRQGEKLPSSANVYVPYSWPEDSNTQTLTSLGGVSAASASNVCCANFPIPLCIIEFCLLGSYSILGTTIFSPACSGSSNSLLLPVFYVVFRRYLLPLLTSWASIVFC